MRLLTLLLVICFIGGGFAAVAKKLRVVEPKPLSDEEPGSKEYDHEAFLGEEEAKTFDELPEEESVRRLSIIADRLDENKDGKVDKDELKAWIKKAQTRYVEEDADAQLKNSDANGNGHVEWEEYYKNTYSHITEEDLNREEEDNSFSYKKMIDRDRKRWKSADENGDDNLSRDELMSFLHPEEFPKMKDVVLDETIDDIDKNHDGFIDLEEYIGDMWRPDDGDGQEPDWVKTEREQFSTVRDKDKDNKLNREEMRSWILPDEYDAIDAEASHLIYEADDDKPIDFPQLLGISKVVQDLETNHVLTVDLKTANPIILSSTRFEECPLLNVTACITGLGITVTRIVLGLAMSYTAFISVLCATCVLAGVTKKDRVVDSHLSDKEPGTEDYDHEAFVGKMEAEEYKELSPEESKRRLTIIFTKIDTDDDGLVSEPELIDWITNTQQRYLSDNTKREFSTHDEDKNDIITWDEYYQLNFGFLQEADWEDDSNEYSYKKMLARDKARWAAADEDGDNNLTLEEYQAYLHPEEFTRMKDVVLDETLSDMDKDGDGMLSMEEYMNDIYRPETKDEVEPDWVEVEREQFLKYRDEDKDGKLNRDEVKKWILPEDYNHAVAETQHLIHESDDNKDGHISKDEMLEHQSVFVGSQATEWGDMINRHDEF